MKVSTYFAIPIAYAICLVLLASEAQAKASTTQIEDISKWTQDQVYAYLDKYNIVYDKKDESLLDTVAKYRDSAVANTKLFFTDKVDGTTRFTDKLRIKLAKKYNLGANSIDGFITDLTHELRQLELSGKLTEDQVKQYLDNYRLKAVKQKLISESQWKEIANDIAHYFARPTWYQRIFHTGHSTNSYFSEDAFHKWITNTVASRLQTNNKYTQKQLDAIGSTLQNAIQTASASLQDLSQIGSKSWWQQFSKDIQKNAGIKQDQAQAAIDSLSADINSYKIFAINYAGGAADQTQNFIAAATQYVKDKSNDIYQAVVHPLRTNPEKEAQINSALYSASVAAASATNSAASSASSLRAKVTGAANDYKDNIAGSANNVKGHVANNAQYVADSVNYAKQKAADNANYARDYAADSANYAKEKAAENVNYAADSANYAKEYVADSANSAKDFAADGATYAKEKAADSANSAKDYVAGSAHSAKDYVASAKDYVTGSANYAKEYVAGSANSVKDYVVDSVAEAKNSLGKFWRQTELDSYRKVGYTQAHIDWMENYLSETFQSKTHVAQDTIQNAIQTLHKYLTEAKVQTAKDIETQLKSLENTIRAWRLHHDEL